MLYGAYTTKILVITVLACVGGYDPTHCQKDVTTCGIVDRDTWVNLSSQDKHLDLIFR